jgi:hypothetical protein
MPSKTIKNCPRCDQHLRFPENVGGVVMVCPSCGHKFYSDFKLGNDRQHPPLLNKRDNYNRQKTRKTGNGLRVIA